MLLVHPTEPHEETYIILATDPLLYLPAREPACLSPSPEPPPPSLSSPPLHLYKVNRCYPYNCEGERDGEIVHAFTNFGSVTRGNVGIMSPGTIGLNPDDIPAEHSHNLNLATTVVGTPRVLK